MPAKRESLKRLHSEGKHFLSSGRTRGLTSRRQLELGIFEDVRDLLNTNIRQVTKERGKERVWNKCPLIFT